MDTITAKEALTPHMGETRHLCIYINGQMLDEIVSQKEDGSYLGLIPAWLNYYEEQYPPSKKEKEYVWRQAKLGEGKKTLPILLCPDDFDFSCTVIVVEAEQQGNTVVWHRFGADVTGYSTGESTLPAYIGKKVEWFKGIGPYTFSKEEYLCCVGAFRELYK